MPWDIPSHLIAVRLLLVDTSDPVGQVGRILQLELVYRRVRLSDVLETEALTSLRETASR